MDNLWVAVLSGIAGTAIAVAGTFSVQYFFRRRDERQQADRDRVAMVLEYIGRARGMVMWAAYIHSHAYLTRQWRAQPALLLGQLRAVDLKDFAATYIEYSTSILSLGGRLVAIEGGDIKPTIDEIAQVTFELVKCYLTPSDPRPGVIRWLWPAVPIEKEKVAGLADRLQRLTMELERQLLQGCRTTRGA